MTGDLDTTDYRRALARFATGVAVVTARTAQGMPVGMTMNSFSSVSLDPPLILFSIDRSAYSLEAFQAAEAYAVNVLSADDEDLCRRFAEPLADKWQGIAFHPGHGGAPVIAGAIAHFECAPWATYDGGDHLIFVCRVVRFARRHGGGALVCFDGQFHALGSGGAAPGNRADAAPIAFKRGQS